MGSQLLRAIGDRNESLAAFHQLKESVQKDARVFPDHRLGWQGGGVRRTAYWLSKLGFWAVLEHTPPNDKQRRFWNCFGLGNPAEQNMLPIIVEINPPHEGENRRTAGLFARDEEDRIYIAHTGRVGGGRRGIGQNAFRQFLDHDAWHEIETQSGIRIAALLGPIGAQNFTYQLGNFVRKVADFKQEAVKASPR